MRGNGAEAMQDVEAALRAKALAAMAALHQGIAHTEQKLHQCLEVLTNVRADVQQYRQEQIQAIQDAYQKELQQLTDAYEQQVRSLESRTQQRVSQLQEAADSALRQAAELLLQELQPGQLPALTQQQPADLQKVSAGTLAGDVAATELSLSAMAAAGEEPGLAEPAPQQQQLLAAPAQLQPVTATAATSGGVERGAGRGRRGSSSGGGGSRRGSILDDAPVGAGQSDSRRAVEQLQQQQQQQAKAAPHRSSWAPDVGLQDQGASHHQPAEQHRLWRAAPFSSRYGRPAEAEGAASTPQAAPAPQREDVSHTKEEPGHRSPQPRASTQTWSAGLQGAVPGAQPAAAAWQPAARRDGVPLQPRSCEAGHGSAPQASSGAAQGTRNRHSTSSSSLCNTPASARLASERGGYDARAGDAGDMPAFGTPHVSAVLRSALSFDDRLRRALASDGAQLPPQQQQPQQQQPQQQQPQQQQQQQPLSWPGPIPPLAPRQQQPSRQPAARRGSCSAAAESVLRGARGSREELEQGWQAGLLRAAGQAAGVGPAAGVWAPHTTNNIRAAAPSTGGGAPQPLSSVRLSLVSCPSSDDEDEGAQDGRRPQQPRQQEQPVRCASLGAGSRQPLRWSSIREVVGVASCRGSNGAGAAAAPTLGGRAAGGGVLSRGAARAQHSSLLDLLDG